MKMEPGNGAQCDVDQLPRKHMLQFNLACVNVVGHAQVAHRPVTCARPVAVKYLSCAYVVQKTFL
jgi:hypothetical protein